MAEKIETNSGIILINNQILMVAIELCEEEESNHARVTETSQTIDATCQILYIYIKNYYINIVLLILVIVLLDRDCFKKKNT